MVIRGLFLRSTSNINYYKYIAVRLAIRTAPAIIYLQYQYRPDTPARRTS